jgi:hypothetical protein
VQLLAVASFPACAAGASGGSLQVSWTVWEGACLTPKPLLRSTSLDSPVLKLPGFSLDPMTSCSVQVSVGGVFCAVQGQCAAAGGPGRRGGGHRWGSTRSVSSRARVAVDHPRAVRWTAIFCDWPAGRLELCGDLCCRWQAALSCCPPLQASLALLSTALLPATHQSNQIKSQVNKHRVGACQWVLGKME